MRDMVKRRRRAACAAVALALTVAVGLVAPHDVAAQLAAPTTELPDGTAPYATDLLTVARAADVVSDYECLDASTCFAGGAPAMRTLDGGMTWLPIGSTDADPARTLQRIDCLSTTRCVASNADGTILVSADRGATWSSAASAIRAFDVACIDADRCVVVGTIAGTAGASVLTTDGGRSWTSPIAQSVAVDRAACSAAGFCIGIGASLASSTDGGRTWVARLDINVAQPSSIDCSGPDTCLVLATSGLVRVHPATHSPLNPPDLLTVYPTALACGTTGCIATGTQPFSVLPIAQIVDPLVGALAIVPLPDPVGGVSGLHCIATRCSTVGIAEAPPANSTPLAVTATSENGGITWSTRVSTDRPERLLDLACPARDTCIAVGGNGNRGTPAPLFPDLNQQALIRRTTDGGVTWATVAAPPAARLVMQVDCTGMLCIATGWSGGSSRSIVLRSADAGTSWQVAPAPTSSTPATTQCTDSACLLAVPAASGYQVYRTTDGIDWTVRSQTATFAFTCFDAGTCFTDDSSGGLLVSTDDAATWTPAVTPAGASQISVRWCALTRCAATSNSAQQSLESADGGRTWSVSASGSAFTQVSCVLGRCLAIASTGLALPADEGSVISTAPVARLTWLGDVTLAFECSARDRCYTLERAAGVGPTTLRRIDLLTPPVRAVTPARLLDTRPLGYTVDQRHESVGIVPAGSTYRLDVRGRGGIGATATAANLNVTVTGASSGGFVTAFPCDRDRPNASNVNVPAGATIANGATVPLAADGTVCLFTSTTAHLIVDAAGYVPAGVASWTAVEPARIFDTRIDPIARTVDGQHVGTGRLAAGATYALPVRGRGGVGPDATAVTMTVTAVQPDAPGFVTVHPCDRQRPTASTLNYAAGDVVANAVTVPVAADGTICLFTLGGSDLVVDVNAFTGASASKVTAITPARLADTRTGPGIVTVDGQSLGAGPVRTVSFPIQVAGRGGVPASARTAVLTVTATGAAAPTFLSVYGCGSPPNASVVNVVPGQTIANTVIVDTSRNICVASPSLVDVIIDVNAYTL